MYLHVHHYSCTLTQTLALSVSLSLSPSLSTSTPCARSGLPSCSLNTAVLYLCHKTNRSQEVSPNWLFGVRSLVEFSGGGNSLQFYLCVSNKLAIKFAVYEIFILTAEASGTMIRTGKTEERGVTDGSVWNSVSLWPEARGGQREREQPLSPEKSREIMHGN